MRYDRRAFMQGMAAAMAGTWFVSRSGFSENTPPIRMGACDWSLGEALKPEALETAKRIGLNGVEISAGNPADTLEIASPDLRAKYKEMMKQTGVKVCSVAMGLLNQAPLASDKRAPAWLDQTIAGAKDLGAPIILLAFFGLGDLRKGKTLKEKEVAAIVEHIRNAAPTAKAAGVTLAIEDTLSGEDNLRILDRIGSDSVRCYYDIGNSTGNDFDVPAEIRAMKDRICQIHFKDGKNFLGKGEVDVVKAAEAIHDIGYKGWIILETSTPSGNRDADFKTNLDYVRTLFPAI